MLWKRQSRTYLADCSNAREGVPLKLEKCEYANTKHYKRPFTTPTNMQTNMQTTALYLDVF